MKHTEPVITASLLLRIIPIQSAHQFIERLCTVSITTFAVAYLLTGAFLETQAHKYMIGAGIIGGLSSLYAALPGIMHTRVDTHERILHALDILDNIIVRQGYIKTETSGSEFVYEARRKIFRSRENTVKIKYDETEAKILGPISALRIIHHILEKR